MIVHTRRGGTEGGGCCVGAAKVPKGWSVLRVMFPYSHFFELRDVVTVRCALVHFSMESQPLSAYVSLAVVPILETSDE